MSDKLLTQEQVEAVVQFSQGLWAAERYGVYTPWLQNQLLNNLNNNAKVPTYQNIVEALSTYKESANNLQGYMEFMQKFDILVRTHLLKPIINLLNMRKIRSESINSLITLITRLSLEKCFKK